MVTSHENCSRLVVKNLPKGFTEQKVRQIFQKFGQISDISLKYTSSGVFRRFAFVGFLSSNSCQQAIDKLNGTFLQGFKLLVELCQRLGSDNISRPWKKSLKPNSNGKRLHSDCASENAVKKIKKEGIDKTQKEEETAKDSASNMNSANTQEPNIKPGSSHSNEGTQDEKILDTGRLFLRNLPYACTEGDITELFKRYGTLSDVQCIINKKTGECKGFAIVTFMFPENALSAYKDLDGTVFKGRMLHILAGEESKSTDNGTSNFALSQFQKEKITNLKTAASKSSSRNWNTLFLGQNAIAESLVEKFEIEKRHLLIEDGENSAAIRMAMAETKLVKETRFFFLENGVCLDAFSRPAAQRSNSVIIVKNLPAGTKCDELKKMFSKFGDIQRIIMPPERGISAIVEMGNEVDAKKAFNGLSYYRLRNQPLYLEWAPFDVFKESKKTAQTRDLIKSSGANIKTNECDGCDNNGLVSVTDDSLDTISKTKPDNREETKNSDEDSNNQKERTKILVRNVPFQASLKEVQQLFSAFGEIKFVRMPKKPASQKEHRGFCFVDFLSVGDAKRAFEALIHSTHLYGRRLVLEWAKQDDSVEELRSKSVSKVQLKSRITKKASKNSILDSIEREKLLGTEFVDD